MIGYGAGEENGEISSWTYASSGSEGFHDGVIPEMKLGKWVDMHKIGMKTETENGGKIKYGGRHDRGREINICKDTYGVLVYLNIKFQ